MFLDIYKKVLSKNIPLPPCHFSTSKTEKLWIRLVHCASVGIQIMILYFCKTLPLQETGQVYKESLCINAYNFTRTYNYFKNLNLKKKKSITFLRF